MPLSVLVPLEWGRFIEVDHHIFIVLLSLGSSSLRKAPMLTFTSTVRLDYTYMRHEEQDCSFQVRQTWIKKSDGSPPEPPW